MLFDKCFGEWQAELRALILARKGAFNLTEFGQGCFNLLGRNPGTIVSDPEDDVAI